MKRVYLAFAVALLLVAGAAAQSQSLGDIAREARKNKRPSSNKVVYTNETIPKTTTISAPSAAAAPAGEEAAAGDAAEGAPAAEGADAAEGEPKDEQALEQEWRGKFGKQKQEITQLERELDVLDREHKLKLAVFYADAGERLRNDRKWADEERAYQEQIAGKKQEVEAAKQKLAELEEELRRAGLPGRWAE